MKSFFGKTRIEIKLFATFVVFVCFFTFLRYPIGEVSAWMLSLTNEVRLLDDSGEFELEDSGSTKNGKKTKKRTKKKQTVPDRGKPVTSHSPKTTMPIVLVTEFAPSWSDKIFADFPAIRTAKGEEWSKEKTTIRATTDGEFLYLLIRFFDQFPDKAVTSFSKASASQAWKDDSIEIFLMKDKKSKFYCQYVVSVSGAGCFYYNNTTKQYHVGTKGKLPNDFADWGYDAEKFDNRFEITVTIPLSNLGIVQLEPNDSFLMQIVRNYRGQNLKNALTLHLFPSHIYADNRFGITNHDRRTFQPMKVIDANVYSTMDKSDGNVLKGMKVDWE